MTVGDEVYCTLVNSDNYLPGAAVLAHSLRDAGTTRKLAVLVTVASLRYDTLEELRSLYDYVIPVDRITTPNPQNLYLIDRGDLLYAFTKIHLWRLTQFRKIVYLDADTVALRAPDELFDTKAAFAAASDIGWPDIFNSGVMVLTPDMGTYWALQTQAASGDSFDGADQGLLNQYYEHKGWHRLPFSYNCTPSASYQYEPAYRFYKSGISIVHFIGQQKPWTKGRYAGQGGAGAYKELVSKWWAVYDRHYKFLQSDANQGGIVQSRVAGEINNSHYGQGPIQVQAMPTPRIVIEAPPTEQAPPQPVVQQRQFEAPHNDWDATRAPPPASSHPEASNFPTQNYEFNHDPTPFKAPRSYPEPPKNMWYEVPTEKRLPPTARPKPIFPWEERQVQAPTRHFAEDYAPSPPPEPSASAFEATNNSPPSGAPAIKINDDLPQTMEPVPRNAWDDVAGIDDYVRQLNQWQRLRGKLQVLKHEPQEAQSPASDPAASNAVSPGSKVPGAFKDTELPSTERRSSLKLTDFPSSTDRPSLPVTPAPIRRNMFWGEERNNEGELPAAEGVPEQSEWDPNEKLEALRLSSLSLNPSSLVLPAKNVPRRDMPTSSVDIATSPGLFPGSNVTSPGSHVRFEDDPLVSAKEIERQDPPVVAGGSKTGVLGS